MIRIKTFPNLTIIRNQSQFSKTKLKTSLEIKVKKITKAILIASNLMNILICLK
jgi:hypothetical protein